MPVVIVYGIPDDFSEEKIEHELFPDLMEAIIDIKELDLQEDQVNFFFPPERMKMGLGEEINIFVEGLFERPERTNEVRKRLAKSVAKAARKSFPKTKLMECFIRPFDPNLGFADA